MIGKISLEDMQRHSGLTERTLHSYIQKGLLPGPEKAGRYAYYSTKHLYLLELITRLKDLHLPLKKIKMVTENLSQKQIRWLNKGEYLKNLKIPKYEGDIREKKDENERSINYIVKLEITNKILDRLINHNIKFVDDSKNLDFDKFKSYGGGDNIIKKYQKDIWHHFIFDNGLEIKIKITGKKTDKQKLVEFLTIIDNIEIPKDLLHDE